MFASPISKSHASLKAKI
jgi:Mg-chelatase subunit ChlD